MYLFDPMDFAFPKGSATANLQISSYGVWYSHYYMKDFVFVNNPDGTLGVYYDPNYFTGTTETMQNFTSQVNEEFCNILKNKFDETRNEIIQAFYDGYNQIPDCVDPSSYIVGTCASQRYATYFQTYTYKNIPKCYWDKRRNVCATKPHPIGLENEDGTYSDLCCGDNFVVDFDKLTTEPLSAATTNEKFDLMINTELVDAKTRKILSGYPTLRALYDRYVNSSYFTGVQSSAYDYQKMDDVAKLVDNNWIDIIEQVVPATTIWGSVKVYENTVFDRQKFKYRLGTLFTCIEKVDSDMIGYETNVGVDTTIIYPSSGSTSTKVKKCTGVYMKQMDFGSQFIGNVTVFGGKTIEIDTQQYAAPRDGFIRQY